MNGQEAPGALWSLLQRGAQYMAPNALSLLMGEGAPPLPNVPEYGKVPPTTDPRGFGAVAEAANIGQNFMPQAGTAKLGGGALAALIGGLGFKKGIRAYHGSPHDFDRFDMSKIGTGEGMQAYGHGLYFAELEDVARGYRDRNTMSQGMLHHMKGDRAVAIRELEEALRSPMQQDRAAVVKAIEELKSGDMGRMYEVNINAAPEQFLDWDRPLGQQPQLGDIVQKVSQSGGLSARSVLAPEARGDVLYRAMESPFAGKALEYNKWGSSGPSQFLSNAGIPGIKYLDQGSRAGGEGTLNYVLFRDDIIDILRKFGIAAPAAAPLAQLMQEQPQ